MRPFKAAVCLFFLLGISICLCAFNAFGGDSNSGLVKPGATLKKVADGFTFTEGPAADAEGNVYFTDIPNNRILKWTWKDESIAVYREGTAEANGLIFDAQGRLVICEMGTKRVLRDDMVGNITVIADSWNDGNPNMPNDLWIDAEGGIYFSDFSGPGSSTDGGLQVYYISPDGKSVTRATDDLTAPNGLIGTPDGMTLYITDPGAGKTFSYQINPDASLSNKTLFCDQSTDGMAMDENGNLYFSGDEAVTVFSPDGKKIEEIAVPGRSANLTFAGPNRKTLFITAQTTVYTLEMAVRGAPTPLDMASGTGLVASGATLKAIDSQFEFQGTEGPATDADGNVYFTDVFGEKIYKWTWKDGKVSFYRANTGKANGMMFDGRGRLIVCEMGGGRMVVDDLKGNVTVLADSFDGKKFHNPNDLWIDSKGGVYFSHQYFPFPEGGGMPEPPRGEGEGGGMPQGRGEGEGRGGGIPDIDISGMEDELGILYISPDGKKVTRVTTDITGPNGLIGTPDGKTLYVGGKNKVWAYTINADGTLSNKKLFCEENTDGMAMDEHLNVYITADDHVSIYSPAGKLLEKIAMPIGCSNVEFCGKDRKTLFITYRGYIYTLDMAVKGAPLAIELGRQ